MGRDGHLGHNWRANFNSDSETFGWVKFSQLPNGLRKWIDERLANLKP